MLAEKDSEETRSLLADCYSAENKAYKVFHILRDCKSEANRYKFAISCLRIGKFKEAEKALIGSETKARGAENVVNGSYGLYLLAQVC